jgi:hypothetical protein
MESTAHGELPVGAIKKEEGNVPGWLAPTDTPGLFDFRFGHTPCDVVALSENFAITVLNCGGQCGGLQLVYGPGTNSKWLAYADSNVPNGWKVRFSRWVL